MHQGLDPLEPDFDTNYDGRRIPRRGRDPSPRREAGPRMEILRCC